MPFDEEALRHSAQASAQLEETLDQQYKELSERLVEHRDRADLLQRLADQAREQAEADERLVEELAAGLGRACQLRIEHLDRRLRGQRLQEIAIEILAARLQPGEIIHYRQWFSWVEEEGFKVGGKDPLATFLGQIGRSPRVVSAGRRSGLYTLNEAA
ncbi:MAG TPA: hypothetical protein VFP21_12670 [Solirubrobacterales bacterium]|nr:hypothetical protein [Solirubrobacterales bacterium]